MKELRITREEFVEVKEVVETPQPTQTVTGQVNLTVENVTYVNFSKTSSTEQSSKGLGNPPAKEAQLKGLLIDDQYEHFRRSISNLAKYFDVTYAADSFTALRQITCGQQIDLILCKENMPFIDGLTLFAELKKRHIEIPFFLYGESFSSKTLRESLHAGISNVLSYPFDFAELARKVSTARDQCKQNQVEDLLNQEKGYICNTLKQFYYDIDKIMLAIEQYGIPAETINAELDKKLRTGKCIFDEPQRLKYHKRKI